MKLCLSILLTSILFSFKKEMKINRKQPKEIFPNKVGNQWVYTFNGFGAKENEEKKIYVNVIKEINLPDGKIAKVWATRFPNGTDTNYVLSNGKEINIFRSYDIGCDNCKEMPIEKLKYQIPFNTGKSWVLNEDHGDTLQVIAQSSVTVPAGIFKNAFILINKIDKRVFVGNAKRIDTTWIVPYIGIVKRSQQEFQMRAVTGNGVWQLEKFNVK
jgi:hypothetical protein